ncbi:MAG: carbohydrate ABC transporter permease [Acidimicrobiia bacterium]|nr:MAG: carbohydrate ABC transporter permease [Acidimicrobiia bacterium]
MTGHGERTKVQRRAQRERRYAGQRKQTVSRATLYIILAFAGIVAMIPFVWMILGSFKTGAEIRQIPPTFWPENPTLDNFRTILNDPDLPLLLFYRNSMFIAIMNVFSVLFVGSLLGYIFAKFRFKGRDIVFWYILATMMIPAQLTMIPGFLLLAEFGLLNNLWGLIVPSAVDAFAIFLMRQFIISVPDSLIQAARVDGASEFRIYWQIVLPQIKPALATLGLLTFMFNWNAYLWPLIVLTEQSKRTLPIILTWYSTQNSSQLQLVMAASVLMVIPVLIIFAISQRWIVKGLTLTGLK